jgi:hypothetical protein
LAVKLRLFRHLRSGGDAEAVDLYRWHIERRSGWRMAAGLPTDGWKDALDDYVSAASALFGSMAEKGFDPRHAVPIDPDGELLNGSHRVACALALEIERIPVERHPHRVWAPAWDAEWFRANGLDEATIEALQKSVILTQQASR